MTNPSLQVAVPATGALPSRQPAPFLRLRIMVRVGTRMMFHDKLKFAGTLFGVIFAVVLTNQQLGVFLGLLSKNTMFIDNAGRTCGSRRLHPDAAGGKARPHGGAP